MDVMSEQGQWMEILGCGMVDPNVFRAVGIDSNVYTGWAFGIGIERITMLKYGMTDIRPFSKTILVFLVNSFGGYMYLGIDLGGTKTALGLVDNDGNIKYRHSFPSIANDFDGYYSSLENQVSIFFKKYDFNIEQIEAVGVGCAGQIELSSGTIFHSPNLNWSNAPLGNNLRKTFVNANVTVDNDVRAATLGEYLFGLSERPSVYINIFLGTGIGSGIIIGDRILRGHTNSAGELGLTSIDCNGPRHSSGNRGVYEYYGSGTALEKDGRELAQSQLEQTPRQLGGQRICDKAESIEAITGKLYW